MMDAQDCRNYILSGQRPFVAPLVEGLRGQPVHAAAVVLSLLRDENPKVRSTAITVGYELQIEGLEDQLLAMLSDPQGYVRGNACEVLHFMRSHRACDTLVRLLATDPDPLVRYRAAVALGSLGAPEHVSAMSAAANKETEVDHEGTPIADSIRDSIQLISEKASRASGN
jgi:HEAT repeat protein